MKYKLKNLLWLTGFLFILSPIVASAQSVYKANTKVDFIPQVSAIESGKSFWVGIKMQMDDQWHVYWKNPGDSGLASTIEWTLPEGFSTEPIVWPYPHRIDLEPLTSYGYEGEALLLVEVNVPDNISVGEVFEFQAKLNWLACKIECVPGTGYFNFTLPVASTAIVNQAFVAEHQKHKTHYSTKLVHWDAVAQETLDQLHFKLTPLGNNIVSPRGIEFFPEQGNVIQHNAKQLLSKTKEGFQLNVTKSSVFSDKSLKQIKGLFVFEFQDKVQTWKRAYEIDLPVYPAKAQVSPPIGGVDSVWLAVVFAFIGGLILNLMPCVLPVLSIKILALVEQTAQDKRKAISHGLQFTLGILVTFWFLAGFILILQLAGKQVGWGFQFQSPTFLVFMSVLFFWLGLNLLGVFEIGTALTRVENTVKKPFIFSSAFFNGILATIVATPCTAPFMGSALGFALFKPAIVMFLIFTALGLGLAFPFLLLCIFPALLRFVPKPGPWMLTLKKFFSLMFFATVLWLSWVLAAQRGMDAVKALYIGLSVIGISGWIIGKWATLGNPNNIRWTARIIAIVLFLCGFTIGLKGSAIQGDITQTNEFSESGIQWRKYSPELINDLRAQGKPILLDFTAKWCLSCQVNERVALDNKKVVAKIKVLGIVPVKADWTNYDEEITNALAGFGKTSIPLYVLYSSDSNQEPMILPEILTPKIVLDALDKISN